MAQEKNTTQEQAQESKNIQVAQPEEEKSTEIERPWRGRSSMLDPFTMLKRLMSDFGMPSLFGSSLDIGGGDFWAPAIETFERGGNVVLRAELPGLKPEDVRVEVVGDELVVSGERKEEKTEGKGSRRYSERRYGSFERRLTLPPGVDENKIEAKFDSGVLEVSVAVPEKRTSHKIDVKAGATAKNEKSEKTEPPGSIH